MTNVHISIPELDERNLSAEEFFRVIYIMLVHEIEYLIELHPSLSINNLKDYPLQLAKRIVDSARTLHYVIEREHDYIVAFSIIRSIADMLAIFILIYGTQNIEERALRHYLYIIDGMKGRISLLPGELRNNGRLKKEEFEGLQKQIKNAKQNYCSAVDMCIRQIKALLLYSQNTQYIDVLIEKNNWKFKKIVHPKESYKWNQMYDLINLKVDGEFFSSLSDFVHGLSTSLLVVDIDTTTFEPIYGIAISLLGKLREVLDKLYVKDIAIVREKMLSVLVDEAMPEHYVKYILEQFKKSRS